MGGGSYKWAGVITYEQVKSAIGGGIYLWVG